MEHSPDRVKPRDVEEFNPRDRRTIQEIDEALADYDAYVVADHQLALEGVAEYERWLRGEQNGTNI